jgi:hypothetical protein
MAPKHFNPVRLPNPKMFFRKHDFGKRDYETLMVSYIPARAFEGVPHPRILHCMIFGTLRLQDDFSATDIETVQMLLDAHFNKVYPGHQCNENCTSWTQPEVDDSPSDEPPLSHRIQ